MPCRGITKSGGACGGHPLTNGFCKVHQSQASSQPKEMLKSFGPKVCDMFFTYFFGNLLPHFGFSPVYSLVLRVLLVRISMQLMFNYFRGKPNQLGSIIGWAFVSVVMIFMMLILLWWWDGATWIVWWNEPSMIVKWWNDIERLTTSTRTQVASCAVKPFACPKAELGSSFLELTEIGVLVNYIASDSKEDMLQIQGGPEMGKTSSMQQALCFKSEWVCNAVYVSFRKEDTKSQVKSYDELCTVFETATAKLAAFEKIPHHKKGKDRFRSILNNLVKFQASVNARIVILDDLHAIKYMGADYEGALKLIKETLVEMRKDYATKILFATSDDSFAVKINEILGDRFSSITMGEVPLEECTKGVAVEEDFTNALSRTGRELPICLKFRRGHASVQLTEQTLIGKATQTVSRHPKACLPLLGWYVSRALWLELLDANVAKSESNGSFVMRPMYRHPSIITHCINNPMRIWVSEKESKSPFWVSIDASTIDSLKKAVKAGIPNACALVDAPDITILDPDTKKPVEKQSTALEANSEENPYLFELPTK